MISKEDIFNTIKIHKTDLNRFGIKNIGLFGSYVRNEQSTHSDIDLLIDFIPESENFDNLMSVCDYLDELFNGIKVEVVTKNGLSPYIGPNILKEVVYV